jgi:hypothetical protein
MNLERYSGIVGEFETVLHIGKSLSNRLVGTMPEQNHFAYADTIYTNIICQAISLLRISPPLHNKSNGLWDLQSACAIARCIIESHDVLGYMILNELSPEETEFRVLLWDLHDTQRRSKMLTAIRSQDPRTAEMHARAATLHDRVINHPWFGSISKHIEKKIKKNDAPAFVLTQQELNAANGIDHMYHTNATMWLSQFVHSFPMALNQLSTFHAGSPDALHLCALPLKYVLGFLANAGRIMAIRFPHGGLAMSEHEVRLVNQWCSIVTNGVNQTALSEQV